MALRAALGSFLPNSSMDLMPPLENFIIDGGELRLSVLPAKPFPFINIMQYMLAPDAAIKELNLKLKQTPHDQNVNVPKLQKTKSVVE
jgi:hypothetical protein